jgi:hypothetical protein
MRRFLAGRRPSPAMAVAFVALLAALSGTAVALPGKNSVDSGDLKKNAVKGSDVARNAVTGPKIKNGSVTGADVRDDSLTGADLNESTLGQVPSANSANSANTANSATTANRATSAESVDQIDPSEASFLTEGQTRVVLTRGPVTVTHLCLDGDADNVGESAFRFETTEGAFAIGQISTFLTGTTGATVSGVAFAAGVPGTFSASPASAAEQWIAGTGVVTGPAGNTLFNAHFQLAGEGIATLYSATAECEASISAVE